MKNHLLLLALFSSLVASCASRPKAASAPGAASGSYSCADSATARKELARSPASRSWAKAEEKPGIATKWGEEREDKVGQTTFERSAERTPMEVVSFYYNDERGTTAMKQGKEGQFTVASRKTGKGLATLSLVDSQGKPLKAWDVDGKLICIGEKGGRYQLEVRNNSNSRLEAVLTVDGLDVLDGQPGSFSKRGYVLNSGETYRVQGFRINDNTVAAFRFSVVQDSYAQLLHKNTKNVGVVGLAVFAEKGTSPVAPPSADFERIHADPFPRSPGRYATPPPTR